MKKKQFIFTLLMALNASAQDVIVKKDGTPILTKVLEVNTNNVKYKKHGNQNGPTYTIAISDILSLTYDNGDKENFDNAANTLTETKPAAGGNGPQGLVQLPPDVRNVEIIRQYSTIYQPTEKIKRSNSTPKNCFVFWGVKENSVMSNDELEMTIERHEQISPYSTFKLVKWFSYYIKLYNKTDKTIYIDKGNCFRIFPNTSAYTYYAPSEQTTVTKGNNTGASMNMGAVAGALGIGGIAGQLASGLNVGGGTQHSTSTTYIQQRILAIPPHSFQYLSEDRYVQTKGGIESQYKLVESAEHMNFPSIKLKLPSITSCGEPQVFSEHESSDGIQYIITYSLSDSFSSYSCLTCNMYIKEMIGCKIGFVGESVKSFQKYINDLDDFCIVGFDILSK